MLKTALSSVSELIQQAKTREASRVLRSLLLDRHVIRMLKLEERIRVASILRRLNRSDEALQLLIPLVRGRGRKLATPTPSLMIEYAEILLNLHLIQEARAVLGSSLLTDHPRAKIRLGYSYLYTYDYPQALEILSPVLTRSIAGLDPYEVQVVRVNCMLARSQQVKPGSSNPDLLHEIATLMGECDQLGQKLLKNALIMMGMRVSYLQDLDTRHWLKLAAGMSAEGFSGMMGELYRSLMEYRLKKITRAQLSLKLNAIKVRAELGSQYEIIREADLQWKRLDPQSDLSEVLDRSGLQSYRTYLQSLYSLPPGHQRRWQLGASRAKNLQIHIDATFPPKLARLLQVLVEEQVVPQSPGAIWDRLMSPSFYRGQSSRDCIHQWVKRLKFELKKRQIPAQIIWDKIGYRVREGGLVGMIFFFPLSWATRPTTHHDHRYLVWRSEIQKIPLHALSQLKQKFPAFPARTHQLYLKRATDEGWLVRKGRGPSTQYQVALP